MTRQHPADAPVLKWAPAYAKRVEHGAVGAGKQLAVERFGACSPVVDGGIETRAADDQKL